ncbi:hypothetical protein SDC9_05898 [bioreactor metagenome]|uniref:Uncharacterized protein n=1 Tax=bioreactor metagenome TaxID=1076179 RepID=A0A644T0L5_9ZZZZ
MNVCQTVNLCQNVNACHATEGVSEPFLDTSEFMKTVGAMFAKSVLAVDTNSIQPSIVDVLCVDHRSVIRPATRPVILLVLAGSADSADADSDSGSVSFRFSHSSRSGDAFVGFN